LRTKYKGFTLFAFFAIERDNAQCQKAPVTKRASNPFTLDEDQMGDSYERVLNGSYLYALMYAKFYGIYYSMALYMNATIDMYHK